jgi:hypothetical protein
VSITAREFGRRMAVVGTDYDGGKPGGSTNIKDLFTAYERDSLGACKLTVNFRGRKNESWKLVLLSPTKKSVAAIPNPVPAR